MPGTLIQVPFIFSCEHGGNRIPRQYRQLFKGQTRVLESHRGWDRGALQLARRCARDCHAPLYYSEISRLLIDLNRSPHHRALFSGITRQMDACAKHKVCDEHYFPYRERVESAIRGRQPGPVIHLSFHSFTPALNGVARNADIGLLYDPARPRELTFCRRLQTLLRQAFPDLAIRRNYPYRGTADGFTRYLRARFAARTYLGIELEINQQHVRPGSRYWQGMLEQFGRLLNALSRSD
jgi:predicted N-formylglutamate amidohydrolase